MDVKKARAILMKEGKIAVVKSERSGAYMLPGGRVEKGEEEIETIIREISEELGIDINDNDIKYLVGSCSANKKGDIINKQFNECYLITKSIDVSEIKLQEEEVAEIKFFTKEEVLDRIKNNYDGLTDKTGPWNFLKRILEIK